jgi:L-seryl-tRNA(Ser) seleniumtransferase
VYIRGMPATTDVDPRRLLPSVDQALQRPELAPLVAAHGRETVLQALRKALAALRERAATGDAGVAGALAGLEADVAERIAAAGRPSLVRVLNATGVVVHTNLGRAPLSREAAARVAEIASSYSNLEYDLASGERGSRETHAEARLREMLGVEAVVVVNNCAAAVLLAVNTHAEGRAVLVSRGELVEIGGSFRIPDVIRKGGARLVEVGTTNRTRISDFKDATLGSDGLGLILKVHPSNFRIVGFTEQPSRGELAGVAREAGRPLLEDQGSGLVAPLPGALADEPRVADAIADGADIVTFSGDKLLGGPQAGVAAGLREYVEPMRKNPLYRALRVDKMTLAALDATLVEHQLRGEDARLPVLRMIAATAEELRGRAAALAGRLAASAPALAPALVPGESMVGGGAAPDRGVPTTLVALEPGSRGADRMARALRHGTPPVVARVAESRVLVDLRTIHPDEDELLLAALVAAAR